MLPITSYCSFLLVNFIKEDVPQRECEVFCDTGIIWYLVHCELLLKSALI